MSLKTEDKMWNLKALGGAKLVGAENKIFLDKLVNTMAAAALGPVLLTFLRHVARISANGIAAFKESCSPIG